MQIALSKLEFSATCSDIISTSNVVVNDWYVIVILFLPIFLLSNPEFLIFSDVSSISSLVLSLYFIFRIPPVKSRLSLFWIYCVLEGALLIDIPVIVFSSTVIDWVVVFSSYFIVIEVCPFVKFFPFYIV